MQAAAKKMTKDLLGDIDWIPKVYIMYNIHLRLDIWTKFGTAWPDTKYQLASDDIAL